MNIVSLSSCYPSDATPHAGLFVQRRLSALSKLHSVRMINPIPTPLWTARRDTVTRSEGPPPTWHACMRYIPWLSRPLNPYLYARTVRPLLASWAKRGRVDVIDAHFSWPDAVAAARVAHTLQVPFTVTLRGVLGRCLASPLLAPSIVSALRQAAGVIAVSKQLADLAESVGVAPERIRVIPNGVDVETFRFADRNEARQTLGRSLRETLLVTVGHLCRRKGVHRILRVLPDIIRANHDTRYVIIGAEGGEGRFEAELRRLTKRLHLEQFVTFTGNLAAADVARWLAAADLFVLSSSNEGCCNAIAEALATGLPVVTTDVGGNRELVTPDCGAVVPLSHDTAFHRAVLETLSRSLSRPQIAVANRHRAWNHVASETSAALQAAADTGPMPACQSPVPDCLVR